jgi:hypothetical protein
MGEVSEELQKVFDKLEAVDKNPPRYEYKFYSEYYYTVKLVYPEVTNE